MSVAALATRHGGLFRFLLASRRRSWLRQRRFGETHSLNARTTAPVPNSLKPTTVILCRVSCRLSKAANHDVRLRLKIIHTRELTNRAADCELGQKLTVQSCHTTGAHSICEMACLHAGVTSHLLSSKWIIRSARVIWVASSSTSRLSVRIAKKGTAEDLFSYPGAVSSRIYSF